MLHWRGPFQVEPWSLISIQQENSIFLRGVSFWDFYPSKYSILLRGCNCTDAAGREFPYSKVVCMDFSLFLNFTFGNITVFWQSCLLLIRQVVQWLALAEKGRKWDEESSTPMFEYRWLHNQFWNYNWLHFIKDFLREGIQDFQVWYDDPQSLAIKYQVRLWIKSFP